MNTNRDINNTISDFLNLEDLEKVAKSQKANNDFRINLLKKKNLFDVWLKKQPVVNKDNVKTIAIRNFIYGSENKLYLYELDNVQRKYIHVLSLCAGLKSESVGKNYYKKNMIISKGENYKFNSESTMDVKTLNDVKPIRIIECDICGADINRKDALYNYRGNRSIV
jgi:hypothetical protein